MSDPADLGPVDLVVLSFPGERADNTVVEALTRVVEQGHVVLLDLVHVSRDPDEHVRVTDVDEDLGPTGFGGLPIQARALISEHDVDVVRDGLEPGTSAVMVVYEQSWARELARTIRDAGGQLELHLSVPPESVEDALGSTPAAAGGR